jgi:hypothetical protein
MSDLQSRFQSDPERIAAQVIDGEAVIIDLISGTYFSLAESGGRAWQLMESGCSLEEIATTLASEYGVPETQTRADVGELFRQLGEENLVVCIGAGERMSAPPDRTAAAQAYQPPSLQIYRDMQDLLALDPPMPGLKDIPWK